MQPVWSDDSLFDRRQWLKYGALLGSTLGGRRVRSAAAVLPLATSSLQRSSRQYAMRKSINLGVSLSRKMTLQECFASQARGSMRLKRTTTSKAICLRLPVKRNWLAFAMADKAGIAISGVCSFLSGPTHHSEQRCLRRVWTLLQE
jgi:hypothetical protein